MSRVNCIVFVLTLLLFGGVARPAFAYLDPGTGSMIIQLVLGGVAGLLVIGKLYWHRLKSFLGIKNDTPPDPGEDSE